MERGASAVRRWEALDSNLLVKIFQLLNVLELTSGVGHICRSWRSVCCDPILWKTLDLSVMKSTFIRIPVEPYVYVDGPSQKKLTRVLKLGLSYSRGNTRTLIFHFNLYVNDDQFTYAAERCPRLRRLVMPAWNKIKETGRIRKAISSWKDLESITMPSIENPHLIMRVISKNCKNFKELKVMGPFNMDFASALSKYLPKLKVLSLRCSMMNKVTLIHVLDRLTNLEVLNISHSVLIESPPFVEPDIIMTKLDETILEKASRLREFITCMDDLCIMCQRIKDDEGLMRWYRYEEGLWKADEVCSLAL